jgi:hypothetical protein
MSTLLERIRAWFTGLIGDGPADLSRLDRLDGLR